MFHLTPVIKNIMIINVLMYLMTMVFASLDNTWMYTTFALHYPDAPTFLHLQWVTNIFMHDLDPTHVLFNMLALFFLGRELEQYWGPKRFLITYLAAGIFGGMAHIGVSAIEINGIFGTYTPISDGLWDKGLGSVVGASGSVMGILAAYGLTFPNNMLRLLFPPISLKAKYFVLIYIGMDLLAVAKPGILPGGVAHFAHLGGALVGAILWWWWYKR